MKDLFFSTEDRILFWIAGYRPETPVSALVNSVNEDAKTFVKAAGCKPGNVNRLRVEKSSRYAGCVVYWMEMPHWFRPSLNAFVIDGPMIKWLQY